jgi:phage-related protein
MSLYNVATWSSAIDYPEHSIVWGGSSFPYYYYALVSHTSTASLENDINNGKWGGIAKFRSQSRANFIWKPSYNPNIRTEPTIKVIKFGDGYEQRAPDGISNDLLQIDYVFENRNLAEATAIAHFLRTRGAWESFLHTPPAPYDESKLFVCRAWDFVPVFIDNFRITAKFEEQVV